MRVSLLLPLSALASGCVSMMPAPVPMASLLDPNPGGPARCLLVLLPGAGDRAEAFERAGFIEAVRARRLSVDVVSADATMGYYARGSVVPRLEADVIGPRQAAGSSPRTWLLGASMGGLGSLLFAEAHPSQVEGVLVMSPFLGPESVVNEIRAAGGLAQWKAPPPAPVTGRTYGPQLWRWLQAVVVNGADGPRVEVGWAHGEKLAKADAVLGAALPQAQVYQVEGRHDWRTWRGIFEAWLDASTFARECSGASPVSAGAGPEVSPAER